MKHFIVLILMFSFVSCSSFSKISDETKIGSDEDHVKVYNTRANFRSLTFGDFAFAVNQQQFRKINKKKPHFDDILFYAKTDDPAYDYYVLYNPEEKLIHHENYIVKDTVIGNSRFVLAISKNAPKTDIEYIMGKIAAERE